MIPDMPDARWDDRRESMLADGGHRLWQTWVWKVGWPDVLAKAVVDHPWSYACGLRDGTVLYFSGAIPIDERGLWVHLDEAEDLPDDLLARGRHVVVPGRGLDVRVEAIEWLRDGDS
jgi:hypothetical protein